MARSATGAKAEVPYKEGMTVRGLLEALPPEVKELAQRKEITVIINGSDISVKGGLEARLRDGDEVVLLPLVHGG